MRVLATFGLARLSDIDAAHSVIDGLEADINDLRADIDELRRRNSMVQALAERGGVNLETVFDSKLIERTTEYDDRKVFDTESGLAQVTVYPATGEIVATDPNGLVKGRVVVTLDLLGQLDVSEQQQIKTFLGRVFAALNSPITAVSQPVSLLARPSASMEETAAAGRI